MATLAHNPVAKMKKKNVRRDNQDILLVDDEADLLMVVGQLLEMKGFHVVTAKDPREAMEQLNKHKVRVMVLDVNLAGEDGLRLLDFIKTSHPTVPVILYTGLSHDDKQVNKMLKQGAACYVNKVQTPAALMFAVKQIMEFPPKAAAA
jgi:DNA-binding NtrC family response regulator